MSLHQFNSWFVFRHTSEVGAMVGPLCDPCGSFHAHSPGGVLIDRGWRSVQVVQERLLSYGSP